MITYNQLSDADYITNLNNLVRRDFDLVYGVGFLMEEPIEEIAEQQPDANLQSLIQLLMQPNVASVMFKEQEGAYLSRCCCCLMSESKKIGFVGGMEIPVIERFEAGFIRRC